MMYHQYLLLHKISTSNGVQPRSSAIGHSRLTLFLPRGLILSVMIPPPCVCPPNIRLCIRRSVSVCRIFDNVSEAVCLSVEYSLMYLTPLCLYVNSRLRFLRLCPSIVDRPLSQELVKWRE